MRASSRAVFALEGCEFADLVGQVVVGVLDFVPEDGLSVVECVSDGTGVDIWREQAPIQQENLNEGRKAELARLQDAVHLVHVVE